MVVLCASCVYCDRVIASVDCLGVVTYVHTCNIGDYCRPDDPPDRFFNKCHYRVYLVIFSDRSYTICTSGRADEGDGWTTYSNLHYLVCAANESRCRAAIDCIMRAYEQFSNRHPKGAIWDTSAGFRACNVR
jgi:hypothetical protein